MLRFLLSLLLLPLALSAEEKLYLGAGPYFQTQPYRDADPVILASPVVFFDYGPLYIRWTRVGLYVYGQRREELSWGLSLTAQPQILGFYETESFNQLNRRDATPVLQGMEERESSWEGGLALSAEGRGFFGEFLVLQDILDRSNALKLRAEVGMNLQWGAWYFVPSVLAVWLSQPFSNYYYGVRGDEADSSLNRPAYRSDAALNLAVQAYLKYSMTPQWHLLANLRADRFAETITDSPIVDRGTMISGMLSVMYAFTPFAD